MSMKQREFYRVPLENPAIVETSKGHSIKGNCVNISMGGMCLSLDGEIAHKMPGTVKMKYDQGGGSLEFSAQFSVAWTSTVRKDVPVKQAGIQFTKIDSDNKNKLAQIIYNRLLELEKAKHRPRE